MSVEELSGSVHGWADPRLEQIVDRLRTHVADDPDHSFQVAAFAGGELVLDAWAGPHLGEQSLMVPYSVSKNTLGLTVGLLIERGLLDLDAPVAEVWPTFAAHGKQNVTIRQLLSHQAGLPQATPALSWDELLDDHVGAERLAASMPLWHPGSAFGYHGLTIANLVGGVVHGITGRSVRSYYEDEIRAPLGVDVHLGLPPSEHARLQPVLPMIRPVSAAASTFAPTPFTALAFQPAGPALDAGNDPRSWTYGHPSVSATVDARGLARLFAATVTGVDGVAPLLSADTVAQIGQQQVRGYDEVLGQPNRAHGIVFQKPSPGLDFGGARAFGHDGAMGALACVDPDTGISFGYTVARGPWPGGADPRAVAVARDLAPILGVSS